MIAWRVKFGWLLVIVLMLGGIAASPYETNKSKSNHGGLNFSSDLMSPQQENPANIIYFSDFGFMDEIQFHGPLEDIDIEFYLPLDWAPEAGAQLQVDAVSVISSMFFSETQFNLESLIAGTLNVTLNGVRLEPAVIQGSSQQTLTFNIPEGALKRDITAGSQHLFMQWDALDSCNFNLVTSLTIQPSSKFVIPHLLQQVPLDLTIFPAPLYLKNAAGQGGIRLVVPDQASKADLQAALTISAGLGRLTGDLTDLSIIPVSQLSEGVLASDHLVVLGMKEAFPFLSQVNLADASSASPDTGVVQLAVSPWNQARVILVLTGGNDQAIVKAAMAVSSGELLTANSERTLSLIENVQMNPAAVPLMEYQTFASLGQEDITFSKYGTAEATIVFNIPQGEAIGADAYVDINFNHSQLMEYLQSGIVVRVNGTAIGSIRLGDATSVYSTARLIIPATSLKPGVNKLVIQVNLAPRSICSDPLQADVWVTIFSTSVLHLPTAIQYLETFPQRTLGDYPMPFTDDNELGDTTFILPADDTAAWNSAVRLANQLGINTGGVISKPRVSFAVDAPEANTEMGNIVAIGRPSQLPIILALSGNFLPAVFDSNNALSSEMQERIDFVLPAGDSLGYLEIGVSPGNPQKAIIAVLGSSDEGLAWATDILLDADKRQGLAGDNFAIIQGSSVVAEQIPVQSSTGEIQQPGGEQVLPLETIPIGGEATPAPAEGEALPSAGQIYVWIIPALVGAIILILLVMGIKILSSSANRKKKSDEC